MQPAPHCCAMVATGHLQPSPSLHQAHTLSHPPRLPQGQTGLLPGGNSPLSRSQTLEESPLAALELAASPRDALASPTSPSSIREVVIDSQRLLRSGAGGLLHRVTQAFH